MDYERLFKLVAAGIGLGMSLIFEYAIINSYLFSSVPFTQLWNFNLYGEGSVEMFLLFPMAIIFSVVGVYLVARE